MQIKFEKEVCKELRSLGVDELLSVLLICKHVDKFNLFIATTNYI